MNLPGAAGTSIVDLAAAALRAATGNLSSTITATNTTGATSSLTTGTSVASLIPTGATFAIGNYNSNTGKGFAAVVQALRSDGTSNIISTPRVITMNNEEAEVKVTQEIPLITGQYYQFDRQPSTAPPAPSRRFSAKKSARSSR